MTDERSTDDPSPFGPLFDRRLSEAARDEGLANVTREEWQAAIAQVIVTLAALGRPFTGDEVRAAAAVAGLPQPHHPNAWGAAMRASALAGVIQTTGRSIQSSAVSRHRSRSLEWIGSSFGGPAPIPVVAVLTTRNESLQWGT